MSQEGPLLRLHDQEEEGNIADQGTRGRHDQVCLRSCSGAARRPRMERAERDAGTRYRSHRRVPDWWSFLFFHDIFKAGESALAFARRASSEMLSIARAASSPALFLLRGTHDVQKYVPGPTEQGPFVVPGCFDDDPKHHGPNGLQTTDLPERHLLDEPSDLRSLCGPKGIRTPTFWLPARPAKTVC